MLTFKLKIKNKIDVSEYCENYSYMFRKLYANFELSKDKGFQKKLRSEFNLDSWMFESCRTDVEAKIKQIETATNKRFALLVSLEKSLKTETVKRKKFRLIKKISSIFRDESSLVFGGKAVLQKISFLSNTNKEEAKVWKKKYLENRVLPISIVGEAPQKSNRKFDFDFCNNKSVFKPNMGIKIPIEYYCSKGQNEYLQRLQAQIGAQAISVKLNNDFIWISFDEQKLNGYEFNEMACFKELKAIPKEEKQLRKDCYKKWKGEQKERQLENKIERRLIAFDLNPEYIGFAVIDGDNILHKQVLNLSKLSTRKGLSSTDEKQVYQNNKRIHELRQAWQHIFKIANHYKVAKCAMEELEFKEKINDSAKEGNRKTKNIWHRELTKNLITKYCNINGIELIEVNPAYSSFIGNIKYNYFDPLNAALEIGRRGYNKYLKGGFYPSLGRIDFDTMCHLGLDVQSKTIPNWVEAFRLFKTSGLRYRRGLKDFVEINFQSHKSCTSLYSFV